ncbi:integrase core domain-containing protein [Janthinobacterium sp. LM6]|uniref:integrase core domain-containing protein n=1 Tax=Janthinobacterium sp. LM6 TaxID=1938606 RepID=UPI0012375425
MLRSRIGSILGRSQGTIEAWKTDYNESRPHAFLNDMPPAPSAIPQSTSGSHWRLGVQINLVSCL